MLFLYVNKNLIVGFFLDGGSKYEWEFTVVYLDRSTRSQLTTLFFRILWGTGFWLQIALKAGCWLIWDTTEMYKNLHLCLRCLWARCLNSSHDSYCIKENFVHAAVSSFLSALPINRWMAVTGERGKRISSTHMAGRWQGKSIWRLMETSQLTCKDTTNRMW